MDFEEWIEFEAERIVRMGKAAPEEHKYDYIQVQILAALKKSYAHGRDGLTLADLPRAL